MAISAAVIDYFDKQQTQVLICLAVLCGMAAKTWEQEPEAGRAVRKQSDHISPTHRKRGERREGGKL